MKCHGCLKNSKDLNKIQCTKATCGKYFCSLCINLAGLSSDKKNNWICPDCCAIIKRGGNNSLTIIKPAEDTYVTMRKKPESASAPATSIEVKELTSEVRTLTQEISSLKQQLENAICSLSSCEKRLDELRSATANNESRIQQLEDRNQHVDLLTSTVKDLQQELNKQAQKFIQNELELVGVPETSNENIHHIALLAIRKVGVEIEKRDIDSVVRVGYRVKSAPVSEVAKVHRPMVVRLLRKDKRDEIVKAAKIRRNITSADIDIPGEPQKIYYNERLTKQNRELFREARFRTKEMGFSYCWSSQGSIFVRKSEGKPARQIRSQDDLAKIFFSSPGGKS